MDFSKMMAAQAIYNDKVIGKNLSQEEKRSISKDLALNTYSSINKMIENLRSSDDIAHSDDLLFSSVDVFRYIMSMLNIWNVDPELVSNAYTEKDLYLDIDYRLKQNKWEGQPVVIVDIDDVIADFRKTFSLFLKDEYNIIADVESEQYYFVNEIIETGKYNPEKVFERFVELRKFKFLDLCEDVREYLSTLRENGYWIQLLTARPKENLKIFYDTYFWLNSANIPFDRIDFSPEKLRWCMNSQYYNSGAIKFAIDDSPKHALEYAEHGISVKVPLKSYNKHIENKNIHFYKNFLELISEVKNAN